MGQGRETNEEHTLAKLHRGDERDHHTHTDGYVTIAMSQNDQSLSSYLIDIVDVQAAAATMRMVQQVAYR